MSSVITGVGMISSVGRDVAASCAAIRAGVSRPRPLEDFKLLDEDTGELVPVTGHPVRGVTEGFGIVGRWMRLGRACVADLVQHSERGSDADFWNRTGLMAIAPYPDSDRFGASENSPSVAVRQAYLEPLRASLKLPLEHADLLCTGPAGAVEALQRAEGWMAAAALERVLVLAVDSYCDPLTLEWLVKNRRLKTTDEAVGLAPGEAGACFLLEGMSSARQRQARTQVAVEGVAVQLEKHHLRAEGVNVGQALSAALAQTLACCAAPRVAGDLLSDLNGESWRAAELGYALARSPQRFGEGLRVIAPAVSLGETGAASCAVSICVAVRALLRGYARTERVLIASSSELGHVGTLCLSKAG